MVVSSKYQKDYSNATFDNPRIIKKRQQRQEFLFRLILIVSSVIFLGLLYLFFYSSYFKIQNIEVNGLQKIKRESIDNIVHNFLTKRRFLLFSGRNFWLMKESALKAEMNKYYYFEKLEIDSRLPNGLVITVVERQPLINWVVNDVCFHIDLTGAAIGYCENDSGLFSIRDLSQKQVTIGQSVITADQLANIIKLHQEVKKRLLDRYNPLFYELNNQLFTAKTDTGPEIRYNLSLGVGEQVGRLDLSLKQKDLADNYLNLKYIDLRFGDKVFYQ